MPNLGLQANTIRTALREEIEAMIAEGAADVAFVDAYKITDAEGCTMTEDGRQYGFHIDLLLLPRPFRFAAFGPSPWG